MSLSPDENPFDLYSSHKDAAKATEEIAEEITATAVTVQSAYRRLKELMHKYRDAGASDSASQEAILTLWKSEITDAMRGK